MTDVAPAIIAPTEAQRASVLDAALDCIVTMDHLGRIVDFNRAAEETFGHRRVDVLGCDMSEVLIPSHLRRRHREDLALYLATDDSPLAGQRMELSALRADGTEFPIELAIARVQGQGPPLIVGFIRDITCRKALEDQLRKVVADLSHADRRKNEFLALLAHELRNPLAPILYAVDVLRRAGTGSVQITGVIERQVGQMVRLVDDLLDVSRIGQGKIELRREQVDLTLIVEQAAEASRPLLQQSSLSLTIILPAVPLRVSADAARLTQVVGNLLNNASKFTPPGGQVWLVLERDDQGAVIRVRDSGIGIAPDELPRVFELFTQLDSGLDRAHGGLGLGLSLARRLVELHDGTIEASSPGLGQGAEFTVRLRVCEDDRLLTLNAPATDDESAVTPRRILVVDDNEDSAECLALLLRAQGHQVRTANNGVEAVDAAIGFEPDAVLLDIGLPRLNGYEVAARIRALPFGNRVLLVALTGWGQEADRHRAAASGFDVHLVKPADQRTLNKLIARLPPTADL
ncbi:MAG TPA: ATP-binding protein [Vicinamibacterales bacterium]|nr:ATP-binding protein [Vicinamibacterales bacterium]